MSILFRSELIQNKLYDFKKNIRIAGLSGSARAYAVASILADFQKKSPLLIILPDAKEAENFAEDLRFFLSGNSEEHFEVLEFPPWDISPMSRLSPHPLIIGNRIHALYSILYQENSVIVVSANTIINKTLPKAAFVDYLEYLEVNEEAGRDRLIEKLEAGGYSRCSMVEEVGDYAVRGGVIDIFCCLHPFPVRLEFWGDQVESIRTFDPLTQRSMETMTDTVILPASELIQSRVNLIRARSMGRLPAGGNGANFPGKEAWFNHFYESLDSLLDYFSEQAAVILFDPHRINREIESTAKAFFHNEERFREEASEQGIPFPDTKNLLITAEELFNRLERHRQIVFSDITFKKNEEIISVKGQGHLNTDLQIQLAGKGRVSLAPLAQHVVEWEKSGARVVFLNRTETQSARLSEFLKNYDVKMSQTIQEWKNLPASSGIFSCIGKLSKGFMWPDENLYIFTEDDLFGRSSKTHHESKTNRRFGWSALSQLQEGDFVVHEEHGVGRYGGLKKMEIQEKTNDFVIIEYSRGDKLYVPADRISILQKYAGSDDTSPKLDSLGGKAWLMAKQKAKSSIKQIARQLVELYAVRKFRKGFAFSVPDQEYREFEATFEYEETTDQIKAIEDVLTDMANDRPMDRLICGDVGFGKTEIALRASFKAVADGKQVVVLVPTTVLAEQHYETFKKRLDPFGIKVGILNRFKSRAEQTVTAAKLRDGEINVIIGTHRLLQKDIVVKDLGLLIIDEEQRFGVKQKEQLKKIRTSVDVLAITATPVPRTLQMSMVGIRDLSVIETPPADRKSINSYISKYDPVLIRRAIREELERKGQVFFVHNRVQDINKKASEIKELVPEARLSIAHGQMKPSELENTMISFLKHEIDVLVCTTIIEAGLDIPVANTIIINDADHLGLAQIYQLRGRVGRAGEQAYAYLLFADETSLTNNAEKRLKTLMDSSFLGAGLQLAMHDLKIRGGGNILGFAQSGTIKTVGYELYVKLIEQAVAELKGEEWHDEVNPEINANVKAYLPDSYISDADVRLNLYRRMSCMSQTDELEKIRLEIKDRFGAIPLEAERLMSIMSIRILLKKLGVSRLDVSNTGLSLIFSANSTVEPVKIVKLISGRPKQYSLLDDNKFYIKLAHKSETDLDAVEKVLTSISADLLG